MSAQVDFVPDHCPYVVALRTGTPSIRFQQRSPNQPDCRNTRFESTSTSATLPSEGGGLSKLHI